MCHWVQNWGFRSFESLGYLYVPICAHAHVICVYCIPFCGVRGYLERYSKILVFSAHKDDGNLIPFHLFFSSNKLTLLSNYVTIITLVQ